MVIDSSLIEVFRDARTQGTRWDELVRVLNRLEALGRTDEQGRAWARVAAELSNYSVNQLRQMQRTLASLETLHSKTKELDLASTLHAFPFSHLEMLGRIAKLDPEAAVKYLGSAGTENRQRRYRELREHYYTLRDKSPQQTSPIAAGLKSSRQFEDLCLELLKASNASELYGSHDRSPYDPEFNLDGSQISRPQPDLQCRITRWPGAFRYASPNLLIEVRTTGAQPRIDAADCITVYGDIGQEETIRHMRRIAYEASFFTMFWIMLPIWSPNWLFAKECETLELLNVGVAAVDPQNRVISVVRPPKGLPKHDRRKLLDDAISTYLKFS